MAPKAAKRAGGSVAGRPRKAPRLTPEEEKLQAVARALEAAASLPDAPRALLLAVLPTSLGAPADARHAVQDKVVGMISECLAKVRSEKEAAAAQAGEEATATEGRLAELQAAEAAAGSDVEEKTKAVQDRTSALDSADAALAEARAALADTQQAERAAVEAEATRKAEHAALDTAVAEHMGPLKEGAWDDDALTGKQHVEGLKPALQRAKLDNSVLDTFTISGPKKAADRSTFDCMVIEQVASSLSDVAADLQKELLEVGSGAVAAAAAVAAQAEEVEKAEAQASQHKSELEQAQAQRQESEALLKDAALELKSFSAEAKRLTKARDAKQADLDRFTSGPLAAFEALRDASSKSVEASQEAALTAEEAAAAVTVGGA